MILEGITDTKEVKDLCNIATEIVGLEQGSLTSKSRKEPYALARQVVANICLKNGIHFVTIAKVLNRDRSNIYHYQKKHADNFKLWAQYRNLLTKQDLRNHLLSNGVKTSTGEVFIIVKSGVLKTSIRTSYKDFSNQLEKIRIALLDYRFSLDVQI